MDYRSKERTLTTEIYTDGSLKKIGNLTFGGWAFIVVRDSKKIAEFAGNEYNTTNQRMELQAIKNALEYAQQNRRENERIIIYSDSAYAINCYNQQWYIKWIDNGWITSTKKDVANQDLWRDIIPYFKNFWYYFQKVPGHSGNFWNEECDNLAQMFAAQLKQTWRGENGYK